MRKSALIHVLKVDVVSIAKNIVKKIKSLRHVENRKQLKIDLKYKFFLFDQNWMRHPLFGRAYPKPGMPRRITIGMIALIVSGVGFLTYLHSQALADWYDTTWTYRKQITINHSQVPSTQTDFPVLVMLTDTSLVANAQSTGNDIMFTSSNGTTKLSHEIESYDSSTGHLVAWVKVPSLSSSSDTILYMYYGNSSAASQQDATNVWDSNYKGVFHMSDDPSLTTDGNCGGGTAEECDSTSNNNDLDESGNLTTDDLIPGQIGPAIHFDGATDDYLIKNVADQTSNFTVSLWAKSDTPTQTEFSGLFSSADAGTNNSFQISTGDNSSFCTDETQYGVWGRTSGGGSSSTFGCFGTIETNWQMLTVTWNGTSITTYLNGVLVETNPISYTGLIEYFKIGMNRNGALPFDGALDEIRILSTNRNADWIQTEYNNQSYPGSFITVGTQQQKKNPVLYWKFDEANGTTIRDASGNNKTATASASVTWQNKDLCAFEGSCLKFDGSTSYVSRGYSSDSSIDPGTNSFSVGAWFRHPTSFSGTDTIISRISAINGVGYKIYYSSTSGLCFGIDDTAGSFPADDACSNTSYADNKWHYVEGVKYTTSAIKIFVDGKEADVDGSLAATGSLNSAGPPLPFTVGTDFDGIQNGWDGFIDEVKYYDYARSNEEIKADYNAKGSVLGASVSLGVSNAGSSLTNGLVGYWKMDDGVGNACSSGVNKACDSSGNGNVGTWSNQTASTSGKFGYATVYDGTNDVTEVADPSNGSLDFGSGSFTVSQWVYPTTEISGSDHSLYKGGSSNSDDGYDFELGNGQWLAAISDGSTRVTSQLTSDGPTNEWVHIVMVVDRANRTFKTYYNGLLTDSTDITNYGAINSPRALRFGANFADSNDYAGKIDETRIYNRALSTREVTTLYDWAPGPVGWWKLDEATGTTAKDNSGNGLDGTISTTDNPPTWGSGKYGRALKFPGTNANGVGPVDMGSGAESKLDFDESSSFTYEAWIMADGNLTAFDSPLFNGGGAAGALTAGYTFQLGSGVWIARIADTTTHVISADLGTSTYGQWTHIAAVVDRDNQLLITYRNGVQTDSQSISTVGTLKNASRTFGIGGQTTGSDEFWGSVDDVRVYNYARTSKQITSDMNSGHPAVGSPVGSALLHFKFDDGFGNVASNSGSLGSTTQGNLYNFSTPPTNASGWSNDGKFGKTLTFDGINDHVKIPSPNLPTTDFTYSMWINMDVVNDETIFQAAGSGGVGNEIVLNMGSTQNGKLSMGIDNAAFFTFSPTFVARRWYHIIVTRQDGTIRLYVDSKLADTKYDNFTLDFGTCQLNLGVDVDAGCTGGLSNWMHGKIDEFKVYDYALNANEIKVDYNQGKGIVLGSLSTNPDNRTASNSAARAYCPPGNAETNCAGTAGLNPAPVGEWKLDERTGTTVHDTSGNGYEGTLTNGPRWASGKKGGGVLFDSSGDIITTTAVPAWSQFTLEAWLYPKSAGEASFARIMSNPGFVVFFNGAGGQLQFSATAWATDGTWHIDNVPFNQWSHVVVTYDYSSLANNPTIYLNGVSQTVTADTSPAGGYTNPSDVIYFGNRGAEDRTFDGILDDLRIYNYTRSQAQVAWDFNKGQPVAFYKFDECTGDIIHNSASQPSATASAARTSGSRIGASGSNTSSGTCNSGSSSEAWANGKTGKFNSSLHFDGTDDYVTFAGPNILPTDDFTYSAWIKMIDIDDETVFMASDRGGGNEIYIGVGTGTTAGTLRVNVNDTNIINGKQVMAAGNWYHIVITRSSGTVKAYINGKLDNQGTENTTLNFKSCQLLIGVDADTVCTGTLGNYFSGQIDDAMIFNYALSPSQIKVLYNQNAAVRFGPNTGRP